MSGGRARAEVAAPRPQELAIVTLVPSRRRTGAAALALCLSAGTLAALSPGTAAAAVPLDLETATVAQLDALMDSGASTSVEITAGYLERISALSVGGPALNAVRVVNPDALAEAAAADARRAAGESGPLLGVPVLLKDNIDVKGLPNTAGSLALAGNVVPADAPLVTSLRAAGAVVLGKTNLTEFANFLTTGMPAGYSSLGGQVLNAYDASQTPSGSSAGSGVAASVGLAPLTIGTETSGSILSPAAANSLVGVKPTVGLVPRTGIIPIAASQDTAGPMVTTVADAAALLSAISSVDPADPVTAGNPLAGHDFTGDLSTTALQGARLGVVGDPAPAPTAGAAPPDTTVLFGAALDVLRAQGATVTTGVVLAPAPPSATPTVGTASTLVYEFKRDLNAYLATRTAPGYGIRTLQDVIEFNDANAAVTLKYGQTLALAAQRTDTIADAAAAAVQRARDLAGSKGRLDRTFENGTPDDPSDDFDALLYLNQGGAGIGATAGYPTVLVPAGYTSGQGAASVGGDPAGNRRPFSISFLGQAYDEPALLGLASDYEAATRLRRPPSELNPTLFRCTTLPGSDRTGCPAVGTPTPDAPAPAPVVVPPPSASPSSASPSTSPSPSTTIAPSTVASPAAACARPAEVVLDRTSIGATGSAGVTVSAAASATVELYAYTRPSTAYRLVRTGVTGADGTVRLAPLRPPANTRLYAQVRGCPPAATTSVVLDVRTTLTLAATRTGPRTVTLTGDSLPARPGGLVVSVYRVARDGGQVLVGQTRADATTGRWRLERTLPAGRYGLVARTGQDLQNAPGSSTVRLTLVH